MVFVMTQNHTISILIVKSVRMVNLMLNGGFYWRRVFHLILNIEIDKPEIAIVIYSIVERSWLRFSIHSKLTGYLLSSHSMRMMVNGEW